MPGSERPGHDSNRIDFIDFLRGWAVLFMIETHVVNATLTEELMRTSFFEVVKFINGLVAPSFLFASGLAYAAAARRKLREYLSFGSPLFRQIRRLLTIALIGYLLHIPVLPITRLFTGGTPEEWRTLLQVDILQCIAASLLIMQAVLLTVRSERLFFRSTIVLGLFVVFVSPFMWAADFTDHRALALTSYLNGNLGSLFPLFPWAGFLMIGIYAGYSFQNAVAEKNEETWLKSFFWAGGSAVLLGILLRPLSQLYPEHDYWLASPGFFMLRLGVIILITSLMIVASRAERGTIGETVLLFGRESLLVYVAHLLVLYGDLGEWNLRRVIGQSFGYGEAAVLTIVLVVPMYGASLFWSRTKRDSPRISKAVPRILFVVIAGILLFGSSP